MGLIARCKFWKIGAENNSKLLSTFLFKITMLNDLCFPLLWWWYGIVWTGFNSRFGVLINRCRHKYFEVVSLVLARKPAPSKSAFSVCTCLGTHKGKPFFTKIDLEVTFGCSFGGGNYYWCQLSWWMSLEQFTGLTRTLGCTWLLISVVELAENGNLFALFPLYQVFSSVSFTKKKLPRV